MRRLLISCAVVAVALLAQLTIVNRLALPGGAGPDLVLLAVVALALTGGALPGLLTGFLAGLALDVAPPASHTIGQYALVFCLVGYGCGRLAGGLGEASPGLYVGISATAAAAGAALHAALGVMLSDPEVTWAAVRHVLPPSLIYDVILSPFVLYAVVRLNGWAGRSGAGESAAAATASASWAGGAAGLPGLAGGAVRQASASGTPRLNLGDRRGSEAWILAAPRTASTAHPGVLRRPGGRGEPRLRFGGPGGAVGRPATGGKAGGPGGSAATRVTGSKAPRMRFTPGRRDALAGRGTGMTARAAVPRFRGRSVTGTIGTGGAPSRTTPRRGAFGGRRALGRRPSIGRGSSGGGVSPRPGSFGRGLSVRTLFGRGRSGRGLSVPSLPGRGAFRRGSPRRGSFGGMSSGRGASGGSSPGRGAFRRGSPRRGSLGGTSSGRGSSGGSWSGRGASGGSSTGRGAFRRGSRRWGSFGGMSSGRGPSGGSSPGRGSSGRGSFSRRPAPRLRTRRGSVRARVRRFLGRGTGGYR